MTNAHATTTKTSDEPAVDRLSHAKNYANELSVSRLREMADHYQSRWTDARRLEKSASIQKVKPWRSSTGPRTAQGKIRASLNACKGNPADSLLRRAMRAQARFLRTVHAACRHRDMGSPLAPRLMAACLEEGRGVTASLLASLMIWNAFSLVTVRNNE